MIRDQRSYRDGGISGTLKAVVETVVPLKVVAPGVGNGADTTEDILASFSIPANTLGANGVQGLAIYAWGTMAANADNKTVKLYFGSKVIASPTAATNGKNWFLYLEVFRTGVSTQVVVGGGQVDTTGITVFCDPAGAEAETAAILVKATGTAGTANANDITCKALLVQTIEQKKTT